MARIKTIAPVNVRCADCRNERPVTNEFPAYDGSAVFATCVHLKHYRQRSWEKPCAYFQAKDEEQQQMGIKVTK